MPTILEYAFVYAEKELERCRQEIQVLQEAVNELGIVVNELRTPASAPTSAPQPGTDGKVVEWTCSICAWRKMAEDAAKATKNTVVAFSNHECSEYPVGLNLTRKRVLLAFMWPQPA